MFSLFILFDPLKYTVDRDGTSENHLPGHCCLAYPSHMPFELQLYFGTVTSAFREDIWEDGYV